MLIKCNNALISLLWNVSFSSKDHWSLILWVAVIVTIKFYLSWSVYHGILQGCWFTIKAPSHYTKVCLFLWNGKLGHILKLHFFIYKRTALLHIYHSSNVSQQCKKLLILKYNTYLAFWTFAYFISKNVKQTNVEKYFIWPLYKWKSILQNGKIVNTSEKLYINRTLAFVKSSWKMKSLKTSEDKWEIYTYCKANQRLSVHSKSVMSIDAHKHAIRYTRV